MQFQGTWINRGWILVAICAVLLTGVASQPARARERPKAPGPERLAGGDWAAIQALLPPVQQAYFKAPQVSEGDQFGNSVAVSGDTVVVGAWREDSSITGVQNTDTPIIDEAATDAGAAYVFVRTSEGIWHQQAYLKPFQVSPGDGFGLSVSIDGNTIVIGARQEDSNTTGVQNTATPTVNEAATDAGAAYVFVRTGADWTQQAYLKAPQINPDDWFGYSVAVDSNTIVVGSIQEDSDITGVQNTAMPIVNELAFNAGAAYVFTRDMSGGWSQQAYLKAAQISMMDSFGYDVGVSGETIVIGVREEDSSTAGVQNGPPPVVDENAHDAGAAYVYIRSGMEWSRQSYLKASQVSADDYFGWNVAVDGDTIVVGAYGEDSSTAGIQNTATPTVDEAAVDAGAAYVFVRAAGAATWSQQAYLKASQVSAGDRFGRSVAVDGDRIIIGAPFEDSSTQGVQHSATPTVNELAVNAGAAFVMVRSAAGAPTWSQQAYLKSSQVSEEDLFGFDVELSGERVVSGAYQEDSSTTGVQTGPTPTVNEALLNAGAAYSFAEGEIPPPTNTPTNTPTTTPTNTPTNTPMLSPRQHLPLLMRESGIIPAPRHQ